MKFIALTIVVSHLVALSAPCPGGVATAPVVRGSDAALAMTTPMDVEMAGHHATAHGQHAGQHAQHSRHAEQVRDAQQIRHVGEHTKPVHHARHCEEGQPDTMQAKCPCGCGGVPYTSGSSARLGYGLFPAADEPLPVFFRTTPIASAPRNVIAPSLATDHVPISFQLV